MIMDGMFCLTGGMACRHQSLMTGHMGQLRCGHNVTNGIKAGSGCFHHGIGLDIASAIDDNFHGVETQISGHRLAAHGHQQTLRFNGLTGSGGLIFQGADHTGF